MFPFGWLQWIVREPFAGAWQRDIEWTTDSVLAHWAVYACVTLISNDVGKLTPRLVERDANGIWKETDSPAFSPVIRKPNQYQNHIQFKQWSTMSKLLRGNTYILKVRDERGVVKREYILDPQRVQVLVSDDGQVFYRLGADNLTGLREIDRTIPASEIIHDRMNCLFHPLVGISPIFASGLAANMGLKMLENSSRFFENGSNPSGVITAPKTIPQATADRIKQHWDKEYSGENSGKVAVLGDSMEFHPMRMTAEDSQLIEQLRYTAEMVCAAFHVPPFKIGIGNLPTYNNGELLNAIYYSDCLQSLIEEYELCQDEGLGIGVANPKEGGKVMGVELDLDDLLKMDTATLTTSLKEGVAAGIIAPNEARRRLNLPPKPGGDTPYMQQQNYSIAALNERDRAGPPPNTAGDRRQTPPAPPKVEQDEDEGDEQDQEEQRRMMARRKHFARKIRLRARSIAIGN